MLEEIAAIRANSIAGRYDRDIAALKDTSTMVTPPVEQGKPSPSIRGRGKGSGVRELGWGRGGCRVRR